MASVLVKIRTPVLLFSKSLVRLKHVQFAQKDLEELDIAKKSTKIYYLNQSYLFHLVALWEKFIEDLALYGFEKMTKNVDLGKAESIIKSHVNYFAENMNSPKQENIDKFFRNTLGIEKISNAWEWEGMSKGQACSILKTIIEARNQIGHTSYTKHELSFEKNFEYAEHLYNLAYLTQHEVERHVANINGEDFTQKIQIPYPLKRSKS